MLKIFLIALGLFQSSMCGNFAEPKPSVPANNNAPLPAPTPPPTPIKSDSEPPLSECSLKRAQGLPPGVNIPQTLCFDETKPVDAKEKSDAKVGNSPQSATIEEMNLPFENLPAEVQTIVRLTVPDLDTAAVVFDLTIIPTADERAKNRLVKSYSYDSSSKNKSAGKDSNRHSWLFKRQNNLLKLEFAEIAKGK